ncbi:MAG TPA: serine/threonine-protein kinase, partial [Kofleriaceae bacterium]
MSTDRSSADVTLATRVRCEDGRMDARGVDEDADPIKLADLMIGMAARLDQPIYLEPQGQQYALRAEGTRSIEIPIDAGVARAAIARLSFIAELELAGARSTSATLPIRCMDRERDIVVTIRPGATLRADLIALPVPQPRTAAKGGIPQVGDTIGNYAIVEQLGEGGMGTVFRVTHTSLERHYAMKILRTTVIERDPAATQQFLREARLAARIRHPHIVDVFDFGYLADGRPYLVMELLAGESLAHLVDRGPVPAADVVALARQLASALAAAHDVGVIHADVTPANALVANHAVKLVDFGLARLRADQGELSEDFVLGTPAYISPEQLRGMPATEYSDQYGLGAVLFHLINGMQPYYNENLRAMCLMHLNDPIPPVVSPLGPLPAKLGEIVTRCLQKSPQARF